ncbi:MAG: orotate phosphoribosyltransferase [Xenococcaceae cyanobacterium MO_188.B19]|nr:orotate phosphoribosyltransferase [Xenococcaceae cyanobacterium MO_188.B19]
MSNQTITTASLQTANHDELRQILLEMLVKYAYKEGDFTLSSGARSTYYINGKQVTLRAEGALVIGRLIWQMLPENTEAVAGLTLGADPMVSAVSIVSALENKPIPALIIRKKPKGHGTKAYIEGCSLNSSAKIVVLEDVVTTGKSALLAVERLQAAGYQVTEIIALVDRNQGGRELYQSQGLKFKAIFDIAELQGYAT